MRRFILLKNRYTYPLLIGILLPITATGRQSVTYEQLLREMIDLVSLSEYPDPPYLAARASSNETTSPVDSVPAGYGNYDHGHYRDTLPEGYLMLDAQGPGVVTHFWSARSNGHLVFYLDNDTAPSWTVPMTKLLKGTGCIPEPFSHVASQGENCYFPIPYRERCRVFYKGDVPDIYYHIDYRTYTSATELPTFDTTMFSDYANLIDSIGTVLSDSTDDANSDETPDPAFTGAIAPGQSVTVSTLEGPGAITELVVHDGHELPPAFLRTCLLEIVFDGAEYPQVRLPLGDFFCAVPNRRPFRMLPVRITANGTMICRWYMPYRRQAEIRLVNHGDRTDSCSVTVVSRSATFTDNTMHFFARWRQDSGCVIDRHLYWNIYMADPFHEHPMLHITGKGLHVGSLLHIWNRGSAWWGEGDEKITLDDHTEPSFLGTGTEDYFGYAWSNTQAFSHAYHSQPFSEGHGGHTLNARCHISDPQPFTTAYRFDLEIQAAIEPTVMDFGRAVFFYALGEATTDHDTITEADLFLRDFTSPAHHLSADHATAAALRLRFDAFHNRIIADNSAKGKQPVYIKILRPDGRAVMQIRSNGHTVFVGTAALPSGVYLAVATTAETKARARFIITR